MDINEHNIERLMEKALSAKNIKVYYQPKYDAVTSRLCGAEALARWVTPSGDVISPACFVPLLEKNGMVTKLDWYILEETCAFLRRQLDSGVKPVTISVNFSRIHTGENNFMSRLNGTVDKYELPHELIEAEITESALEKAGTSIIDFVGNIRAGGYSAAIDDFGSGLSSLNFVKDVPANVIKIDKSLLSANCEDEKERIVLESIFEFANRLRLTTVAEGVETKEQLGFLRTCGCQVIQGYLFSKPLTEENYNEVCKNAHIDEPASEDILLTQPTATATELLLEAVFTCYPLVIFSNLTRNSFYMMAYSNFSTKSCPSTGVYTELIAHGASTMHPDDQKLFSDTFDIPRQVRLYDEGKKFHSVITRQLGDDGVYRRVETTNYFVKNPSADDLLTITLSRAIE